MNRYLSAIVLLCTIFMSVQVVATTYVPIRVGKIRVIIPIDEAPEAASDIINVDEDDTIDLGPILLRNDIDEAMESVEIVIASPADLSTLNGTLSQAGNVLNYTPAANEWGEAYDSFTYYLVDEKGNTSDLATVSINVDSVNDLPVYNPPPPNPNKPHWQVTEDAWASFSGVIDVSDVDGDPITISHVRAINGSVHVQEPNRTQFIYTPAPDFHGADDVFISVTDGTDIIKFNYRVIVENTPDPLEVIRKVEVDNNNVKVIMITDDPDGPPDTIFADIGNGAIKSPIYTHCAFIEAPRKCQYEWNVGSLADGYYILNVFGTDSDGVEFSYASNTGNGYNFSIGQANKNPLAVNDIYTVVGNGEPYVLDVTLNDSDPNADKVTLLSVVEGPSEGSVTILSAANSPAKGSVTHLSDVDSLSASASEMANKLQYTPTMTQSAKTDYMTYRVSDGKGGTATASVNLIVEPFEPVSPITNLAMQINSETGLNSALVRPGAQVHFTWSRPAIDYDNITYCLMRWQQGTSGVNPTDGDICLATTTETELSYVLNSVRTERLIVRPCLGTSTFCGSSNTVTVEVTNLDLEGLSASDTTIPQGTSTTISWDRILGNDVEYIIEVDRPESQNGEQTANWYRLEEGRRFTASQRASTLNLLGTYRFRVKVCSDSLGCGEFSAPISIRVEEFVVAEFAVASFNVSLTSQPYVLNLWWSSVNLSGVNYVVEVKPPATTSFQNIPLSASDATSVAYTATDGNGSYSFRVKACTGTSNCSEWREASLDVDGSVRSRRITFIHTDLLGSPVAETDENGDEQ